MQRWRAERSDGPNVTSFGMLMNDSQSTFLDAFRLLASGNSELWNIVLLSLQVTGAAVLIATLIGLPLGSILALKQFRGRGPILILLSALMGLPPVVVGLLVYMALSNVGPLGVLGLLYTPSAMIIAQTILVLPIIAALSRQVIEDYAGEYHEQLAIMGLSTWASMRTLVYEARHSLLVVLLAGFGRAIAEVGAVMIVGGNIAHLTRTMTTAIALETSRGNLALALGLGVVLICVAVIINGILMAVRRSETRLSYV